MWAYVGLDRAMGGYVRLRWAMSRAMYGYVGLCSVIYI